MFKQVKSILILVIFFSFFIISQAQATCDSSANGNWSAITWSCGHVPTIGDNAVIAHNVTLNQDATVNSVNILLGCTLNTDSNTHTLTLAAATEPIYNAGTFNAGTSTVKLTDANHSLSSSIAFYNLQWATTPLIASRTLTINGTISITGTLNIDGTPTNPVTLAGSGDFLSSVTVNNCASATVTNVTCNAPVPGGVVSAPFGFSFKDKPVIFSEELKE